MRAIISVSDKTDIVHLCQQLQLLLPQLELYASGGTSKLLQSHSVIHSTIESLTHHPEILSGRVKTLHPAIHGGILARIQQPNTDNSLIATRDNQDLMKFHYDHIDLVICNLYPFEKTLSSTTDTDTIIEEIDIGGVTLLRSSAKNYKKMTVICDPKSYSTLITTLQTIPPNIRTTAIRLSHILEESYRLMLAFCSFEHTCLYDSHVSNYFRSAMSPEFNISLRYGMNPHQIPSNAFSWNRCLPITILNGSPSMINLLDALNSWPLVKELKQTLNLTSAASFKHVSPSGVGLSIPLTDKEAKVFMVDGIGSLSPQAIAYARARGADRMCSFGDWIALSDSCDLTTAVIISREVSDGIIAPSYEPDALSTLKKKKNGSYCIIQIDPLYEPDDTEIRQVYGVTIQQKRNNVLLTEQNILNKIVSSNRNVSDDQKRDLLLAKITLKYTQSNSVCITTRGGVIGLGAGQQSRIHCTRLAVKKAENWWLRHHPRVLQMSFSPLLKRPEMSNAIDLYVSDELDNPRIYEEWKKNFDSHPKLLEPNERKEWLSKLSNVSLASDGFFPFEDNIHCAASIGVQAIVAPSGSVADDKIINVANKYNMIMFFSSIRLFHH